MIQLSIRDEPVNVVDWFKFLTFDIIGQLTLWETASWVLKRIPFLKWFIEVETWLHQRARSRISLGIQGENGRSDFLSHILAPSGEDGDIITEEEILSNAFLLIVARGDTTATAIPGLLFYLAQNRQAYETLSAEIRNRFHESNINFRNCAAFPYSNACIQETMWLYPPAPEIPTRVSPGDGIDGRDVPVGTYIFVYLTATGRNPRHFTDPPRFHPEL
ncbi:hypothetical protein XA68_10993 [Ophiocordyceps unilateralis]|uniref:Cytochrome P450 n=1 Tax=Ophiocordyceps unilateralis TaxID=268505 RepID=A0A2A9PQB8_OPHUN|nr:hypothetical protein XA68_10993 [Ophiocordyceps unilateralis]